MFGTFLFLTYYMQGTLHYSPVATGFTYLPMIAGLVGAAQVATNALLPRFGPKYLVASGMVMAAGAMFLLTGTGLHSSYVMAILPGLVLLGLGFGFTMAPSMSVATIALPADAGIASAMVNTTQQVGGSVGTSLLNTLGASAVISYALAHHTATAGVTSLQLQAQATVHGYHVVFAYAAVLVLVGAVVSGLLLRRGAMTSLARADEGTKDDEGIEPVLVTA